MTSSIFSLAEPLSMMLPASDFLGADKSFTIVSEPFCQSFSRSSPREDGDNS